MRTRIVPLPKIKFYFMGFLQDLGDALTGGASGIIGGAMNLAGQLWTGHKNREMQQKENAKDRAFNSAEAEKQRNFEEQMYIQHESPIAQAQARAQAGLNPAEGISSQSVGTGSTASAHSSALPAMQAPSFEFISQLPLLAQQIRGAKLDNEARRINNDILLQQYTVAQANAIKSAIEANDYSNAYQLAQDIARETLNEKRGNVRKVEQEAIRILLDNTAYQQFLNTGANDYITKNNLSNSERILNETQSALNDAMNAYTKNKDSREAQELVIKEMRNLAEIQYLGVLCQVGNAQAQQALSQVDVNNSLAGKYDAEKISISDGNSRAAAAHIVDMQLKDLEKSMKLTEKQKNEILAYKTKVMNGDIHNFNDFMNGLMYHISDIIHGVTLSHNSNVSHTTIAK